MASQVTDHYTHYQARIAAYIAEAQCASTIEQHDYLWYCAWLYAQDLRAHFPAWKPFTKDTSSCSSGTV